jgi:hypothetical protein
MLEKRRILKKFVSENNYIPLNPLKVTDGYTVAIEFLLSFSLWVIHKEGLCPSSGDINRLMMMIEFLYVWTTDLAYCVVSFHHYHPHPPHKSLLSISFHLISLFIHPFYIIEPSQHILLNFSHIFFHITLFSYHLIP